MKSGIRSDLIGGAIVTGLACVSLLVRWPNFTEGQGAQNVEATWHALLTIRALQENPTAHHHGLPTVTLGGVHDKWVPWGEAVPTPTGDAIYTSFPPFGFIVPAVILRAARVPATVASLALFNVVVGATTALLLFGLIRRVLDDEGCGHFSSVLGAVIASTIAIFSREALQSHGVVYWPHCLVQPMLVVGVWLLRGWLMAPRGTRLWWTAGLAGIAFLTSLTEWTGAVFAAGLAGVCFIGPPRPSRSIGTALLLLAMGGLAFAVTFAHLGLSVGWEPMLRSLSNRFMARSAATGTLLDLLQGYALSYGMFLVTLAAALVVGLFSRERRAAEHTDDRHQPSVTHLLIFATTFPLIENGILLEHAAAFSFDRLKFLIPSALLVAVVFSRVGTGWRAALTAAILASSVHGVTSYRNDLKKYDLWAVAHARNEVLAKEIARRVDLGTAILATNVQVRGYVPLLINRAVYGNRSLGDLQLLVGEKSASVGIFLEGRLAHTDLPAFDRAILLWPDGRVEEVGGSGAELPPIQISPDFFLTDRNWDHGVSRNFAGFFLPNLGQFTREYRAGRFITLRTGDRRRIARVEDHGKYLHVYVDGAVMKPDLEGDPTEYRVVDEEK